MSQSNCFNIYVSKVRSKLKGASKKNKIKNHKRMGGAIIGAFENSWIN